MMTNALSKRLSILLVILALSGCDLIDGLKEESDQKFGDQHFKTAIALIELHKVRTGAYPETFSDIQYTGDWDMIVAHSVSYKKLEEGYELNIVRGWVGTPELNYPEDFWSGLGVRKTNVGGLTSNTP
ncbi:hypothetical protein [Hahella sp. KA22]|uniref:hypothetical protein n=1 Tax=Hahella sp. KA22 TaxID=1628392 RepID=UPI0019D41FD5|nr:hypothetical protein [Hahella sp. KA22]